MKNHQLQKLTGRPAPYVMGVLNVTPDSFTDGGDYIDRTKAIARGHEMRSDAADLVDIGGESTAPGSQPINAEEELSRIERIVEALSPNMPLSIDTYRSTTAARCLELGAVMINDVSALRADPDLAAVIREHRAILAMMHAKDGPLPHASDNAKVYQNVVTEAGDFLSERIDKALDLGIDEDRLIVDPGWGRFVSLEPEDTWTLLATLEQLAERLDPIPLMVGTSRKGFLGVPMADRDPVSQLTALVGTIKGAALIRTHHPRMAVQFLEAARKMRLLGEAGK